MQGQATNKYFTEQNKRALIIARSTFAGQGKFTSHWLGDNFSDWPYLKYSITGILSMNIFGINFSGSDICGFIGYADPNLCQRWTIVGAFYPFARNHDEINDAGQEPYRYSKEIQANMRNAIRWRYALLRYYYTQLYLVSQNGGTFWKPLFFEFPQEPHAYDDIERNIMIGPALKFSTMIDRSDAKTQTYIFPAGTWCNIIDYSCQKITRTSDLALPTTPDQINLHIRDGYIIPLQRQAVSANVNSTTDLNGLPMGLMINANSNTAKGVFYADDGDQLNPELFTVISMNFTFDGNRNGKLNFAVQQNGYSANFTHIGMIEFVGASFTNLYRCTKMKVDGGDEIIGKFDSGTRLLSFKFNPQEMNKISTIEFYS